MKKAAYLSCHTGFPIDLTGLILRERGKSFNETAVERLMDEERQKSRSLPFSYSPSNPPTSTPSSQFIPRSPPAELVKQLKSQGDTFPPRCSFLIFYRLYLLYPGILSVFSGYESLEEEASELIAAQGAPASQGQHMWLTINPCPFYPTQGGQIADQGMSYPHYQDSLPHISDSNV